MDATTTEPLASATLEQLSDAIAAADVPLSLAALAGELAGIGETLASSGNPRLHSDALTTTCLAAAVATSAAALVAENLRSRPGDPRRVQAEEHGGEASAAARRVVGTREPMAPPTR